MVSKVPRKSNGKIDWKAYDKILIEVGDTEVYLYEYKKELAGI